MAKKGKARKPSGAVGKVPKVRSRNSWTLAN
jgi:hypothetical protein